MSSKFVRPGFALAVAVLIGAPLMAAPTTPLDIVKGRIALFNEMGTALKNVNDQLKMDSPTSYFIQIQAREINNYSRLQYSWFPAGTGQGKGLKTKAKAEVWTQAAQFKAAQDALATQSKALIEAAAEGDIAKMQAASKAVAQTCSNCHRAFRAEKAG